MTKIIMDTVFLLFIPILDSSYGGEKFHKAFSSRAKAKDYLSKRMELAIKYNEPKTKEMQQEKLELEKTYGDLDYSQFTNRKTDIELYGFISEVKIF